MSNEVLILGGTGYVAGEALRLLSAHPNFEVVGVASNSSAGQPIVDFFPHLTGATIPAHFCSLEVAKELNFEAIVCALPHGETSAILDQLAPISKVKIVDLSADHRFAPGPYGFFCGLPDFASGPVPNRVAHPGCFTTCVTLGAAPILASGLVDNEVVAFGVTGSTGSGRAPKAGTHHPDRNSGMWAYNLLSHRHGPEMKILLAPFAGGTEPTLSFLPHSGPFSRGIHATLSFKLTHPSDTKQLIESAQAFYAASPFITVGSGMPNIKDVVGSNRCHIGIAVEGDQVAVTSVIDNLVKGAAGGGVHWLNLMFGLPPTAGLTQTALGWT